MTDRTVTDRTDTMRYLCVTLVIISCCLEVQALRGYGHVHRRYSAPRFKKDVTCDPTYKYRSYDGSCNNLDHPEYGMIGAAFRRVLDPVYEDGVGNTPRLKSVTGNDLPGPRSVSVRLHDAVNFTIPRVNQMLMQWSQFLDHDITWTPTEDDPGNCCYDTLVTDGELHPDVTNGGACFPIIIDENDRYFDTVSNRCMNFVRSAHVTDSNGVRQQYNAITPWIDGSQVYGYTEDLANSLRSFTDGKLKVVTIDGEDFLPRDEDAGDETCFLIEGDDYCFLAGDHRVNVFPGLSALHTVFLRYHNSICGRLKALHSDWEDETLYQEARRIVIAVIQRITYDEFMQQLLGPANAEHFDLLFGSENYAYDSSIDPTLPNVFSTAAYRFGHSLVTDSLTMGGRFYETGVLYMRPMYVLNSLKDVIEAILNEESQRADRWYSEGITDKMFEKPNQPKTGYDIAARNIQRGRDHGLPPYNDWREHYGLSRKTFNELDSGGNLYQRVYESVDDIDLYSGGITELPHNTARIGELYVNILGNQFRDLKFGDRFWFENLDNVSSFSVRQLREIRRITLARVICDTVPDITQIQARIMKVADATNPLVDCSAIGDMNIEMFW